MTATMTSIATPEGPAPGGSGLLGFARGCMALAAMPNTALARKHGSCQASSRQAGSRQAGACQSSLHRIDARQADSHAADSRRVDSYPADSSQTDAGLAKTRDTNETLAHPHESIAGQRAQTSRKVQTTQTGPAARAAQTAQTAQDSAESHDVVDMEFANVEYRTPELPYEHAPHPAGASRGHKWRCGCRIGSSGALTGDSGEQPPSSHAQASQASTCQNPACPVRAHDAPGQPAQTLHSRMLKAYCDAVSGVTRLGGEEGVTTAEYAVVLVAATSFAAVLLGILKSDVVRDALTSLITRALSVV